MINFKIRDGDFKKIRRKADALALRVSKKANRRAVSKAATPMLREAKLRVPVETGQLKRDLTKKVRTEPGGVVTAFIGARKNSESSSIVHLVELGSSHSAPSPFLRPAFDLASEESVKVYKAEIWKDIRAEVAKVS